MTSSAETGRLTWLGHSCVAIQLDGLGIVTDPVLRERIVHLRRKKPVDLAALEGVDLVLVSHTHHDHLDLPSLNRLDRHAQVIVPLGAGRLLRRRGFHSVHEVVAGDEVDVGTVRVRVTHAEHASGFRMGTGRVQPVGYVIAGTRTVYFAGDTDLFAGMGSITDHLDVALLPVAGWGPRLPPGHLDPRSAAEALSLLRPRIAVPIHWGTYRRLGLSRDPLVLREPAEEFARLAAELMPEVEVCVLPVGGSVDIGMATKSPRSMGER